MKKFDFDLCNGEVIELRNGKRLFISGHRPGPIWGVSVDDGVEFIWNFISHYKADLTHVSAPELDIVKVFPPVTEKFKKLLNTPTEPLWNRASEVEIVKE